MVDSIEPGKTGPIQKIRRIPRGDSEGEIPQRNRRATLQDSSGQARGRKRKGGSIDDQA